MAATVTVNGDTATFKLQYTGNTTKLNLMLSKAAYGIYTKQNPAADVGSLTNQQKLTILNDYVKKIIKEEAERYHVTKTIQDAAKAADTAARAEAASTMEIGE